MENSQKKLGITHGSFMQFSGFQNCIFASSWPEPYGSVSNNHFLLILLFMLLLHFPLQCIFLEFCSVPAFHSNLHKYACHCCRHWFGGNKRCFKCIELISEHSQGKVGKAESSTGWEKLTCSSYQPYTMPPPNIFFKCL